MPTPFAALETRVNTATTAMLANAVATISGQPIDGVFSKAFVEDGGVESVRPVFIARTAVFPAISHGLPVVIFGVNYTVIGNQPDNGVTTLILERA